MTRKGRLVISLTTLLKFALMCDAAKILGVTPYPSNIHTESFIPLWKYLIKKGHEVNLITSKPFTDYRIKQIDVSELYDTIVIPDLYENLTGCDVGKHNTIFRAIMQIPEIRDMLLVNTEHFDLVLFDFVSPIWAIFGHHFNSTMVALLPFDLFRVHNFFGNPTNPAIHADYYLEYGLDLTLIEKMLNIYHGLIIMGYEYLYLYNTINRFISEYYFAPVNVEEIIKNINIVFINSIEGFYNTRPITSTTIYLGGGNKHISSSINIPKLPKEPLILLDIKNMDMRMSIQILKVISRLPYKCIQLSYNCTIHNNTSILCLHDIERFQILENANIQLVITDGDTPSIEDAIYYKIPMIIVPNYHYQKLNAKKVEKESIGKFEQLYESCESCEEKFEESIIEVLENHRYKLNINIFSESIRKPISGLETASMWIELLLQKKPLYKSVTKLNLLESYYIDVIVAYILVIILIALLFLYLMEKFIVFVTNRAYKKEKQF